MPKFPKPNQTNKELDTRPTVQRGRMNDDMKRQMVQEDRQMVQSQITALPQPDRIVESRCHVCQSPWRDWIEYVLMKGAAYKTISDRVGIHRHSIANHKEKHMTFEGTALRRLLEEDARLQNRDFEDGVQDVITKRNVLEVAMRKGFDDIVNGVTVVEPRDLIQIAKLLGDFDANQYQVGLDELKSQVHIFIQAIKDECSPELQQKIGQRVKELRTRENITTVLESPMEGPPLQEITEVSEVEVVEE